MYNQFNLSVSEFGKGYSSDFTKPKYTGCGPDLAFKEYIEGGCLAAPYPISNTVVTPVGGKTPPSLFSGLCTPCYSAVGTGSLHTKITLHDCIGRHPTEMEWGILVFDYLQCCLD